MISLRYIPKEVSPKSLVGESVRSSDPRHGVIWINPARMSGAPCFYGTRVPIDVLFDLLKAGGSIDEFLDGYPPITREHVIAVLELAKSSLLRVGEAA